MHIETLGHASLYLTDSSNRSILITDPWLIGSTYWRSWWLQHYPTENELKKIYNSEFVYITHQHSDHFHLPSLKKFSKKINLLIPDLPDKTLYNFLNTQDFNHQIIKKNKWRKINSDHSISLLSVPLWNDDSILIIDTIDATIINLNDAKPPKFILKKLGKFVKNNKKKSILLSSYSPASIVNSFRVDKEILSIKSKNDYVFYLNKICDEIKPDIFMPFASQAIFQRKDSTWANEFKVTFDDLQNGWDTKKTKLVPCYSKIDLKDFSIKSLEKVNYNKRTPQIINNKVKQQIDEEEKYDFSDKDIEILETKIKKVNFFINIFFRNGIGFKVEKKNLIYKKKKIYEITENNKNLILNGDFIIEVPGLVLKDVLKNGYFGDLGITMFTLIHTKKGLDPRLVYLFFILIGLDDYGHTKSIIRTIIWASKQLYNYMSFFIKPVKFYSK
jgi:hypothetical protein|tara:strand:- start:1505 stop:2836 length:1332 start_codon:yes stop_codon:yes gene_type:complete